MVMQIHASIVASRSVAVGQLGSQPTVDQGFKAFVDGGQGNAGDLSPDLLKDFVRIRVAGGAGEKSVDCGTLLRESVARSLEGFPETGIGGLIGGFHIYRGTPDKNYENISSRQES
jgi:hypothetical protein